MNERPDFSAYENKATTAPAYFSVYDIHAYYGESYIVQGVSFTVHEGEILALLGRNGAGKTSTLRSLARIGSPNVTQGEIWLDHQPLHKMSSHEASRFGTRQGRLQALRDVIIDAEELASEMQRCAEMPLPHPAARETSSIWGRMLKGF